MNIDSRLGIDVSQPLELEFRRQQQKKRSPGITSGMIIRKWRYCLDDLNIDNNYLQEPVSYISFLFQLTREDYLKGTVLCIYDRAHVIELALYLYLYEGNANFLPAKYFTNNMFCRCFPKEIISVLYPTEPKRKWYSLIQRFMVTQGSVMPNKQQVMIKFITRVRELSQTFGLSLYYGRLIKPTDSQHDQDPENARWNSTMWIKLGVNLNMIAWYNEFGTKLRSFEWGQVQLQKIVYRPMIKFHVHPAGKERDPEVFLTLYFIYIPYSQKFCSSFIFCDCLSTCTIVCYICFFAEIYVENNCFVIWPNAL